MASRSCSPAAQNRPDLSIRLHSPSPLLQVNHHSPSSTKSRLPSAPTDGGTPLPLWRCPLSSITILHRTELDQSGAEFAPPPHTNTQGAFVQPQKLITMPLAAAKGLAEL